MPSDWRISAPGPVAIISGTTPRMKAKAVIRIGRSRSRQASTAASTARGAALLRLAGELDDQDGVLGGEADQHDQADLDEDVVVEAAERDAEQRGEHAERHDQHDGERHDPAFVLRRQRQEHEQHRQAEDEDRGVAGLPLLQREFGPFEGRCPAAASRRRSPPSGRARVPVETPGAALPCSGTETYML